MSHFRAVHRGASFAGLRTTTVRKLLPEYVSLMPFNKYVVSWLFLALIIWYGVGLGVFFVQYTLLMVNHAAC